MRGGLGRGAGGRRCALLIRGTRFPGTPLCGPTRVTQHLRENWAGWFQGPECAPDLAWLAVDPRPASEVWDPQLESGLASASHALGARPCHSRHCSGKGGPTGNGESSQQTPLPCGHRVC